MNGGLVASLVQAGNAARARSSIGRAFPWHGRGRRFDSDRVHLMRLVVDAHSLLPVQPGLGPTGVGRWTAGVLRGLSAVAPEWSIELVLVHRDAVIDPTQFGPNVSVRYIRVSHRLQRRLSVLGLWPRIDRFVGRPDAVLGPNFVTWKSAGAQIPVIHDLTPIRYPEFVSPRNLWFLRAMLGRSVSRAGIVVTVSEAMRTEIVDHYKIDPDRVMVVPNGVDPEVLDRGVQELPEGVPDDFLLFVGTKEPRKNLEGTLIAYEIARRELGAVPPLVVVGGRGWRDSEINTVLSKVPEGSVITMGYVEDGVLSVLYQRARALLFPTFYEGFGLPVLEAMALGCPVVTARVGGIPEVAGDVPIYVDPADPVDIARGIAAVARDDGERSDLIERGRARALAYTWTASGEALRDAVVRAVSAQRP